MPLNAATILATVQSYREWNPVASLIFFPQTMAILRPLGSSFAFEVKQEKKKPADFWTYYSEKMKKKLMCVTSNNVDNG
jgi:hypothetical protein